MTATIQPTCTINSLSNAGTIGGADFTNPGLPAAPTSSINVGAATSGSTAGNVANCNIATHIKLDSANGASTTIGTVGVGFQKFFDYSAAVTFDTASVTLSTATAPGLGAGETATSGTATSGPASGPLGITITSLAPALQLIAGSYSDTLTVTLTAN